MTDAQNINPGEIPRARLLSGAFILVTGFLSPLLIPFVTSTDWSVGLKGVVSGLLAFGIPEVFMLVAIGVLGKQGYEFLKGRALGFLKNIAPSDSVSLLRYRIGLMMFCLPLLMGWVQPYLGHFISFFQEVPLWFYIVGDFIFFASFLVLGGDFWDKFRGLFNYRAKIAKP